MRRICPKCGSTIPEGSIDCPACKEAEKNDRSSDKKLSDAIYMSVVITSSVFAVILLLSSINDLICEPKIRHSIIYIPDCVFSDLLIPIAFMAFTVMIILRRQTKYLVILPIVGIVAEVVQLLTKTHDNHIFIVDRDIYFYGIIVMDFVFSALVLIFLYIMIRMIREDFSITMSRWMIVYAFVLVFAKIMLMICLIDDRELTGNIATYAAQTRIYLLFAITMMNVSKRKLNSDKKYAESLQKNNKA